ncbi:uncharacterized protein SPPG_00287 [Spizellomyces punctatus DAOM BR117]|uniref:NodB homology domain-containing protein n=1 Tax=Spizellomyces punctatus (strain DAOM BR117) TaxID=645134 RepID=A0A0L0HTB6_SPIPD|nr:uncharacterized protein SPPG_00287 [Spizellomyces punctatus DAOM BR117]KND04566.1 hypothetical protein SPPG_00287 [Spizellomyces punctatus DAOM BR117]|eukprot:XP_016612605.1 hypothetical protein SPPG_00287 [Spizellomyces punctatus DAOM BR117]
MYSTAVDPAMQPRTNPKPILTLVDPSPPSLKRRACRLLRRWQVWAVIILFAAGWVIYLVLSQRDNDFVDTGATYELYNNRIDFSLPINATHCGPSQGTRCPDRKCCSAGGLCGLGDYFCSKPRCQDRYGICDNARTSDIPVTTNRSECGIQFGTRCPDSLCCNSNGFCVNEMRGCATFFGCQSKFGKCDNSEAFSRGGYLAGADWPMLNTPPPPKPSWTALVNLSLVAPYGVKPDIRRFSCAAGWPLSNAFVNKPCTNADGCSCWWSCEKQTVAGTVRNCLRDGNEGTDISSCSPQYNNTIGLTFDDGPSEYTAQLLDFLKSKNLTATFFVIGSHVVQYPRILQRAYAEGHTIASHTWSHFPASNMTTEMLIADLLWTELAITKALNIRPRLFRPPFGDIDDRVRTVLTQLDYRAVLWNLSPRDATYDYTDTEADSAQVLVNLEQALDAGKMFPNFILLEHDRANETVQLASPINDILTRRGFQLANAMGPGCTDLTDSQIYGTARSGLL